MMRSVLLVSNMYPSSKQPYFGTFVQVFENGLKDCGFKIVGPVVITSKGTSLFGKLFRYTKLLLKLVFLSFFKKYDVIYVHFLGIHAFFCLIISWLLPSKKVIVNVHGSDLLGEKREVEDSFWKFKMFKRAIMIVVPSAFFRKSLLLKYPEFQDKVFISSSGGVNEAFFYPCKNRESNLKKSFNIGFASRLIESKGLGVLIEAFALFHTSVPHSHLYVAGAGEDEKLFLLEIGRLNLEGKVSLVGGLSHDELGTFLRKLDVFVFPTLFYESLGLVAIEAMACGVPVSASNRGGILDYLEDGKNGFLFEPGDSRQLSDKICEYFKLDQRAKSELVLNAIRTAHTYEHKNVNRQLAVRIAEIVYQT